jgi:hypothetical protein
MNGRPESCVSDFAFDRRLAGEASAEEDARIGDHVRGCARCTERLGALRGERDAFAREAPALKRAVLPLARSRGSARVFGLAAGLLGLAAATVLVVRGADFGAGPGAATRTKGSGASLGVYVKHDGAVRAGGADERVEPGDALRFVYTTVAPRYLAVFSLDGAKRASVYYPDGDVAARVEPGVQVALPSSTVLDEVLGPERLFGVACASSFEVEPLRRALQTTGDVGAGADCEVVTLSLRKEAPAGR